MKKIIGISTFMEDYNKYAERIEIPEMTEQNFKDVFLLVVSNENVREESEVDLEIFDVIANDNTMNIIMKQKENPNYQNQTNVFYAVVDNSVLKDNITIEIEHKE